MIPIGPTSNLTTFLLPNPSGQESTAPTSHRPTTHVASPQVQTAHLLRNEHVVAAADYESVRSSIVAHMIEKKRIRRLALGPHMSVLLENRQSVWFQLQELVRANAIRDPEQLARELASHNRLVPPPGHIVMTLFAEFSDAEQGNHVLTKLGHPANHIRLYAGPHQLQAEPLHIDGEVATAAVNYMRFITHGASRAHLLRGNAPITLALEHDCYRHHVTLSSDQRAALMTDLGLMMCPTKAHLSLMSASAKPAQAH